MNKNKPLVFISYCWDNKEKYYVLDYIKRAIEKKSHNSIDVFLDVASTDVNDDYDEHEQKIKIADLVLVFFTPEYKKALTSPVDRRLKNEYPLIVDMQYDEHKHNCVYPIIFEGNKEDAVPVEFVNHHCYPFFEKLIYFQRSTKSIVFENKSCFDDFISTISNKAQENFENFSPPWSGEDDEENQLLFNTKANNKLPKECMLKVDAYDDIIKQRILFVVGRKGTGKTTLLEIIKGLKADEYHRKYKTLSPVNMDDININRLYGLIRYTDKDRDIITENHLIELYWQLFFILHCMYIVAIEEEKGYIKNTDTRKSVFKKVTALLKNRSGKFETVEDEAIKKGLSDLAIELIENQLNESLKGADKVTIITSYKNRLNAQMIIQQFLGKNFKRYMESFDLCKKKVLICLDGFDVTSEDFRITTLSMKNSNSAEYENRVSFEKLYYRCLMTTVIKLKEAKFHNRMDVFHDKMDFCIILPQDRIDQIKTIDRDSTKRQYSYLCWDAYELFEMVAKRLEYVYRIKPPDGLNYKERIVFVLNQKIKKLPTHINVVINGVEYRFDLLNYILRLSFWRPREIIRHIARLIKISKRIDDMDIGLHENTIKNALFGIANRIIEEELLFEYKHVFYNLNDVLSEFEHTYMLWKTSEFVNKISKLDFEGCFSIDCGITKNKLRILYQLGVVGLYYTKDDARKLSYGHNVCFVFNEGLDPLEDLIENENYNSTRAKIIFNPIFCKKMFLEFNVNEAVFDFSWEYIQENHSRKDIIKRA